MSGTSTAERPRFVAISEEELSALQNRIDALADTVGLMQQRATGGSDNDLLSPKEVGKRYKIDAHKVYAACESGQIMAERRVKNTSAGFVWLITSADAHRWYLDFIRKKVNQ